MQDARSDSLGGGDVERCAAELGCVEGEDGAVEVLLEIEHVGGLCGLFAEVYYDAEAFLLLSCGVEVDGAVFSWYDADGAVRILLDGVENCGGEGVPVRLYFKRLEGAVGGAAFSLGRDIEAFFLADDGSLCELGVDIKSGEVEVGARAREEGRSVPLLVGIEVLCGDGGELDIVLSGEVSGRYFASGFKIFAVEVDSGKSETVYVLGVIGNGDEALFERRVTLSARGRTSIVVTPLAFWRGGVVEGEKYACVAGEIYVDG